MISSNPFRPGVGLQPAYLAGRDGDLRKFRRLLAGAPGIPANARMTGLRGVGKTVLLQRFQEIAEDENWATASIEIEPRHRSDDAFRDLLEGQLSALEQRLSVAARVRAVATSALEAARKIATVNADGFTWSLAGDLDSPTKAVASKILKAVNVAQEQFRDGLVILLDEAQVLVDEKSSDGNHPLSSLVAAISTLQKQNVRVALVLCGLPTLAVNLLSARTYTERMFRGFQIGSLGIEDSRAALTNPLNGSGMEIRDDLVDRVAEEVDGYPYFLQLWGAELWDAAVDASLTTISSEVLDVIQEEIHARLDHDFYTPRIEALTPAEQDLLQATAKCSYPPIRVSELNSQSPKTPENVNVLMGRLVKANVLYRPRKGEYRYTAPMFGDFLRRRAAKDDDGY